MQTNEGIQLDELKAAIWSIYGYGTDITSRILGSR